MSTNFVIGQSKKEVSITKSFFKNGLIAHETYLDSKHITDSIKTYHIVGGLNEKFYFNKKKQLNGLCQKFSSEGKLMTTWSFQKGVLVYRKDYFKEFNLNNKEKTESNYANIVKCDSLLKDKPDNFLLIMSKAISKNYLGEDVLAELDFLKLKNYLEETIVSIESNESEKLKSLNKVLAEIYSMLSTVYSRRENVNLSIQYAVKAVQADPTSNVYLYNLGAAFATQVEDYRLGIYFLEKVVSTKPNHNFANWVLSIIYLEMEQYQKSLDCVNIAFKGEKGLYEKGYGNVESDLRTIRGLVYHKLGKTELGIEDLNASLKINEKNSVANKYLGMIYQDLNENKKACEFFQKSRELGYEKKYYNKSLEYYIKKNCIEEKLLVDSKVISSNNVAKTTLLDNQSTTLVPEISAKDLPYIAPIPAEDFVEVFNYVGINFNFQIFDVSGNLILSGVSNNKIIQVLGIPTGFYILKIEKDKKTEEFKLIKK